MGDYFYLDDPNSKRTNLYIDGTNLFAGLVELFGPKKILDFSSLINEIKKLFTVNKIYFYASYIGKVNLNNQKLRSLVKTESKFYNQVKATPGVYFYKGHRSPTSGKEKGVDVHLAVDIVKDVFSGQCDKVLIMSGDADLIYPLEVVKLLKIPVHAVFLPNRFSLEMAYKVDSAIKNTRNKQVCSFQNKKPRI